MKNYFWIFISTLATLLVACNGNNDYQKGAITAKVMVDYIQRNGWVLNVTALPDDPKAWVNGKKEIVWVYNEKGDQIICVVARFLDTPNRVTIEITHNYLDRDIDWRSKKQYPIYFRYNNQLIVLTGTIK